MAQHAFSSALLGRSWVNFHVGQAVPIFLILMGFNAAQSLDRARVRAERSGKSQSVYPPGYWSGRARRLLIPYLIVWVIALLVGLLLGKGHLGVLTLVGVVPLAATPGNYFITVLVQFVVVFPAFVACLVRWPRTSLAVAVAVNVAFELAAGRLSAIGTSPTVRYLYEAALPKYAVCLVAGVILSQIRPAGLWRVIALPALLSIAYLVALQLDPGAFSWLAPSFSRGTNCFAVFYGVALIVVGLRLLPRVIERLPGAWRPLEEVGRASYHIFLVQLVWFGVVTNRSPVIAVAGIAAATAIGYAFYRLLESSPAIWTG